MNLNRSLILLAVSALALSSCAKKKSIEQDISDTVQVNQRAKDHIEWETSPEHPTQIVKKWREEKKPSAEICAALKKQSAEMLTLFEEEFKKPENKKLIAKCKDEFNKRLQIYWTDQQVVNVETSSFTFPTNIQYRRTKGGYFARSGDVGPKEVILTFDDGPHGEHTPAILAALAKVNAKAIFFAMGDSARANPNTLRQVGAAGHSVGSHSMTHKCLPSSQRCASNNSKVGAGALTTGQAMTEIIRGHKAVFDALGWIDPFFRFPYGETSPVLRSFLFENDMAEFAWSIDSNDWKVQETHQLVNGIMQQVNNLGRGIILMHDMHRRTAVALPSLLRRLYEDGYSVVTLLPEDAKNARHFPHGFSAKIQ